MASPALFRDKEGRLITAYPFYLIIDPILNQGHIFPDEEAVDDAWADDDLLDGATPQTILPMLAERGYRIHYLRSEADLEDDLLPYFAIADGQLQEVLASLWLQQSFEFEGAEHVDWQGTTTRLYTDGERVLCEGHDVKLMLGEDDPRHAALSATVRDWLETYAQQVASEVRAELKHVPRRQG